MIACRAKRENTHVFDFIIVMFLEACVFHREKNLKMKLLTVRADAVLSVTALNWQQVAEIMIYMSRLMAVPMNGLGDDLTMHCCQIAPAGKMIVI